VMIAASPSRKSGVRRSLAFAPALRARLNVTSKWCTRLSIAAAARTASFA